MIKKILIANRGEIAVRIVRACAEMGIRSVAVYSDADRHALHVKRADEAHSIGADPLAGYLNPRALVNLAVETGCDALHPGYGFLSENAELAEICAERGIKFIGPSAEVIRRMGDKTEARRSMIAADVPCTPGTEGNVADIAEALREGDRLGYPVMLKATSGGGGRGIRRCNSREELEQAYPRVISEATKAFDLQIFNEGDYVEAARAQTFAENISKVLYPEDSTPQGKELRLQQQYFFVACSISDFVHEVLPADFDLHRLPERIVFQLNDTHPVIGVPELMRVLVDEKGFDWDEAWAITKQCFAYTCHTLLPEALEVWPVDLLGRLLPRHLEIIYRINDEFLDELRVRYPGDAERVRRMSIIGEGPVRTVRMAYLATVASVKVADRR